MGDKSISNNRQQKNRTIINTSTNKLKARKASSQVNIGISKNLLS